MNKEDKVVVFIIGDVTFVIGMGLFFLSFTLLLNDLKKLFTLIFVAMIFILMGSLFKWYGLSE